MNRQKLTIYEYDGMWKNMESNLNWQVLNKSTQVFIFVQHAPLISSRHFIWLILIYFKKSSSKIEFDFSSTKNWSAARDDRTKSRSLVAFVEKEANDIFPQLS